MGEKVFKNQKNLNFHVKMKHQVILRSSSSLFLQNIHAKYCKLRRWRTWKCLVCQKTFTRGSNLKTHYNNVHKVVRMTGETAQLCSCDICLESFYSNKELMNHRKQEHPQQAYACYICDKAFNTPSRLYMHKYFEHSSKEYACTCGKKFKRKATLKEHHEKYCRMGGRELKDLD